MDPKKSGISQLLALERRPALPVARRIRVRDTWAAIARLPCAHQGHDE